MYTGSANDRRLIRETEFFYPSDRTVRKVRCRTLLAAGRAPLAQ
jgi:hypothetical protein